MASNKPATGGDVLINASPTKEFFIHMLTRDIPLTRAILDLVDNSVDGARRLRASGNYDGLWVRMELSVEQFRIADNCGGITVEIARDYAFRFGRPKEAKGYAGVYGTVWSRHETDVFQTRPPFCCALDNNQLAIHC